MGEPRHWSLVTLVVAATLLGTGLAGAPARAEDPADLARGTLVLYSDKLVKVRWLPVRSLNGRGLPVLDELPQCQAALLCLAVPKTIGIAPELDLANECDKAIVVRFCSRGRCLDVDLEPNGRQVWGIEMVMYTINAVLSGSAKSQRGRLKKCAPAGLDAGTAKHWYEMPIPP